MSRKLFSKGHSLDEYVLPALGIALVTGGALAALSGQIPGVLQNAANGSANAATTTSGNITVNPFGSNTAFTQLSGVIRTGPSGIITVTTGAAVDVSGGAGVITAFSNTIQAKIQQWQNQNQVTPAQASLLMDLANKGHDMAAIASITYDALQASGGDPNTFLNTRVGFNGKSYEARWLGGQIGGRASTLIQNPSDILTFDYKGAALAGNNNAYAQSYQFFDLYHQAYNAGALSDPTVRTAIDALAYDIVLTSDFFSEAVRDYWSKGQSYTGKKISTTSQNNHLRSGQVCNTGGGTGNGTVCF